MTLICPKSTPRGQKIISQIPKIDPHWPKIDSQNANSNPHGPNLTAWGQKATAASPKTDSQMPKIKYTSRITAESGIESHKIYSKRPTTPNFRNISPPKSKLRSQRSIINFSFPKSTLKGLKLILQGRITTPRVPNLTHIHLKLNPRGLELKKKKFADHGPKHNFHMPEIDSNIPQIDSQISKNRLPDAQNWSICPKSIPRTQNRTLMVQKYLLKANKRLPWVPKPGLWCLPIEYTLRIAAEDK